VLAAVGIDYLTFDLGDLGLRIARAQMSSAGLQPWEDQRPWRGVSGGLMLRVSTGLAYGAAAVIALWG